MDNRPTIAEVQEWVLKLYNTCEQTITSEERKEQHKYAVMVSPTMLMSLVVYL